MWAHQHSSWYYSPNKKKSAGLWRLPHFHKVHFKNSWESNHGAGCQSLSSLQRLCLFLHELLVIWVVCLVNHYIRFILFIVACLVVLQQSVSSTVLTDVVALKSWPWSQATSAIWALRSGASFVLCMHRVILETEWMLRLLKLTTSLKCGPRLVGGIVLGLSVLELIIVSTNELQLLAKVNNSTCNQKTILHPSLIQGFVKLFGLQARGFYTHKDWLCEHWAMCCSHITAMEKCMYQFTLCC